MKTFLLTLLVIVMGSVMLYAGLHSFSEDPNSPAHANIQDGRLDLTRVNLSNDRPLRLDGRWEFYWNRLIDPQGGAFVQPSFFAVPSNWKGQVDGQQLTGHGAATYRLVMKMKPSDAVYGMKISNIRMASAIYVNGELVGGGGRPGLTKSAYAYRNNPYSVFFQVKGDTADIVIHAANFDFPQGGIPYDIYFGKARSINELNMTTITLNMVAIIALFMLGIYHLCVYLVRREEKGLLYFGLYAVVSSLAFACNGDRIFMSYVNLPMEPFYKIYTASLFSALILMVLFLRTMCVGLIPVWFSRGVAYAIGLYVLFVLATPFAVYSRFNLTIGFVQILVYLAVIVMLTRSLLKGRYGNFSRNDLLLFILALVCFLVGLIDYTLYLGSIVRDYYPGYLGILGFCMMIAVMMAFRFSQAYQTIASMSVELRQADRLKDEFLVHTAHEFQTPLNGLINLSDAMLEGSSGRLNASQQRNMSIIHDVSRRLSALVRDILDLEKIKRDELSIRPASVDLKAVAAVVFELLAYHSAGKSVELRNEIPDGLPAVLADEDRLKQVVYNLVGNALKFTASGSVVLSASVQRNRLTLFVEDTGIGIAEDQRERAFRAFETLHNPLSEGSGSTGLGLYISRRLMRMMDGDIRVDWSQAGAGTRMAATLPLAKEPPSKAAAMGLAQPEPAAAGGLHAAALPPLRSDRRTVLAVDDEPSNLQVLSSLFEGEFNFLHATNGRDALELLHETPGVDLVLLDVMMPGMSGYETCREIRKRHSLFELPVMLMTVLHSAEDVSAGFEAGANDYVVKPFDLREIRARTATLLQLKQSVGDALKARMDFLQSQIKPHFLFNALNAILSFCRTDGARAEQLLTHLSDYLRRSFDPGQGAYVTVQDELQLVHAYAEIEKARFEERLEIRMDVDEAALPKTLLPLSIQPLVENAIRHGVMRKEDGGTVHVAVKVEDGAVRVEVRDDGVGIPPDRLRTLLDASASADKPARQGVGLLNIHLRLIHFFGNGLKINSAPGEGTTVEYTIGKRS
ncbi:hybrid sensor histidine kinase/response regulator [Paenibacillus glycinis]|uniref:histidine kinase n=1 Tax=Paenibacillus glycinis TaxID=2697035 RepID=A0ABW9XX50_9BACL|nr:ATP-binding protein [Paenibacillus glycinis]NBD27271.1 response regulator [Paenibacillus glycinis]